MVTVWIIHVGKRSRLFSSLIILYATGKSAEEKDEKGCLRGVTD